MMARPPAVDPAAVETILVGFLREECRTAGFVKGVLGLSGGIDSAVVCMLAAKALGPSNVTAVMMPASISNPQSLTDARRVVDATGVAARVVDITEMAEGYLKLIPQVPAIRRGNVYARCRMIVLYDLSAELGALVLGTSNKTELLLGYGTLHGDLASALNPIGDLYKTQLRALALHLGVPEQIRRKPPSADLWVGQEDEQELGASYETLDEVLSALVDELVPAERLIEEGLDAELVRAVAHRIRATQYKRRPPLVAKVSARTIGPDFRLPRDAAIPSGARPPSRTA
jgi:NAD+ synthase